MGARERLPVGLEDVRVGGEVRESRGDAVGARERLPVGCGDVLVGGAERAPRDTAVGARERLPVGPSDATFTHNFELLSWALANGAPQ